MGKQLNVALIGNPNTGKTSVFNQLTGLNQKVGNYPGVTVEKKEGKCKLANGQLAHIVDLPGTYSLNATSPDEKIVADLLLHKTNDTYPDVAVIVADVENLKRNLLLLTQIKDLDIPTILAINMADTMKRKGISVDLKQMEEKLHTRIALISARNNKGMVELKELIQDYEKLSTESCVRFTDIDPAYFETQKKKFNGENLYKRWLNIVLENGSLKPESENQNVYARFENISEAEIKRLQQKETILRYLFINQLLKDTYKRDPALAKDFQSRLDKILTQRILGYVIFFLIMLLVFQSIYNWSSYPMDLIDRLFTQMAEWVEITLPQGALTNLVSEGIIPGIGGIVIFVPQIAFLFLFISLLEESGYMSRVVFLMDKIMRRFGLNGKSVVPLISGTACAIPAIMATRSIDDWKERLITILITPFITCSARLPVYLIIIALVIPENSFLGMNLQGLTLMGLYFLGFLTAVFSGYILNKILKLKSRLFFISEMPAYKLPLLKNIVYTVIEKTKSFVVGAGKIILAISIVLWFLASNGPGEEFRNAENIIQKNEQNQQLTEEDMANAIASYKLHHSYIGIIGRTIEPVIRPLGYDWKIGIALISSLAAREVFVGTLATVYSVGSEEEETIKNRMIKETDAVTGKKIFNFATGISLLLYYAFAMQCISTLAIVKRETNSWKWPVIQLVFMTGFAYVVSLAAYQILK
ncbi:ferrous iron transport protein B [Maribellus comscasis]|uniref:Ferrous iron transport protein B n=1 Tax=Maribellus comscasis TaxID=2681766 RepID=A0A6I6K5D3_9BACT|nr:ferrous iron transport protein B [Maribellus comscasis]QGY46833.1 ferrous iron transport protein B [Maribellus comscasis]